MKIQFLLIIYRYLFNSYFRDFITLLNYKSFFVLSKKKIHERRLRYRFKSLFTKPRFLNIKTLYKYYLVL